MLFVAFGLQALIAKICCNSKLGMRTFTRIAYERIMKLIRRIWRLAALEGRKHFGLQTELVRFKLC